LTFAGDTELAFGLSLETSAGVQVGFGAEPGSTNSHASFANTFGFPTAGPVANLPPGYTLNSLSGHIVDNRFVVPTGDFNSDGNWDCLDLNDLTGAIVAGSTDLAYDMNVDGLVTLADVSDAVVGWLAVGGINNSGQTNGNAYISGDGNLDDVVDGSDFNIWNSHKFTVTAAWCSGDFNADGAVDGSDFNLWNSNKFTSSQLGTVPEPICSVWFVVWAAGVAGRRRP
jgi:hypothetical protein